MARPSISAGVDWIAQNDEPGLNNPGETADLISVLLLADLFGKEPLDIATRVVRRRLELGLIETIEVYMKEPN